MKCLWLDLETTGLDYKNDLIVELGCIVEENNEILEKLHIYVKYPTYPDHYYNPENQASQRTHLTPAILNEKGVESTKLYPGLTGFLNKYVEKFNPLSKFLLCGFNVGFDDAFLRNLFLTNNDSYYGSYFIACKLDVFSAFSELLRLKKLPIFRKVNLESLCKFFDIEYQAHTALEDIRATRLLYQKIKELEKQ